MKVRNIYSLIAGLTFLLFGCNPKLQTYDLNEEYATSIHVEGTPDNDSAPKQEEVSEEDLLAGVPSMNFYGGDLKRGGIWWAQKGNSLEKGDVFIITVTPIIPDSGTPANAPVVSNPFGATFPPIDLVKVPVKLRVSARAEVDSGAALKSPTLHLQFDDGNGFKANAKRPTNQIENSSEFKDYYFELKDMFVQKDPAHKVNGAFVNTIKFYVNPGETPGYSGKIFIKEIKLEPVGAPAK